MLTVQIFHDAIMDMLQTVPQSLILNSSNKIYYGYTFKSSFQISVDQMATGNICATIWSPDTEMAHDLHLLIRDTGEEVSCYCQHDQAVLTRVRKTKISLPLAKYELLIAYENKDDYNDCAGTLSTHRVTGRDSRNIMNT